MKLDYIKEQEMNKAIKRQVKIDRQIWLDKMLEDGNWSAMKAFKKYRKSKNTMTQLRRKDGSI